MNQRRRAQHESGEPSVLGRMAGAFVGALGGAVFYFATHFLSPHAADRLNWSLSGQLKWYIIGGVVLGVLGGWSTVRWLSSFLPETFGEESSPWLVVIALVLLIAAAVAIFIKMSDAA
jgi:uncharacterized membrane-anchored protein